MKRFVKMHGLGNHFIIVNPQFFNFHNKRPILNTFSPQQKNYISSVTRKLCTPNFGISADGILIISQTQDHKFKMSVFNSDGTEGKNCGNGLRCVAAFLHETQKLSNEFNIELQSGSRNVKVKKQSDNLYFVDVNLGMPKQYQIYKNQKTLSQKVINYIGESQMYFANLGNNHLILILSEQRHQIIQKENAYKIIYEQLVGEQLINLTFAVQKNNKLIYVYTYQFGAGFTLACGTGSSIAAYVLYKKGLVDPNIQVITRGGAMFVSIQTIDNKQSIIMKGPAQYVFSGSLDSLPNFV